MRNCLSTRNKNLIWKSIEKSSNSHVLQMSKIHIYWVFFLEIYFVLKIIKYNIINI